MKESLIIVDNSDVKITDLGNDTAEVWFRDTNEKFVYTGDEMRQLTRLVLVAARQIYGGKIPSPSGHPTDAVRERYK